MLTTVASAASVTLDDTRYVVPALTWTTAAEHIGDWATTDLRPENLRVLLLPAFVLDATWACHAALLRAAGGDDHGEHLADLLAGYLVEVHCDLQRLIDALEKVLAVVSLDLPAARTLATHLALDRITEESQAALKDVLAAWRRAGISW